MDTSEHAAPDSGWANGWRVLRVKQELPGDLVSVHAHAAEAQADVQQRGPGRQVFHGRYHVGGDEFIVD